MGDPIKTLDQARQIINNLQTRADHEKRDKQRAYAFIYDLLYADHPEPTNAELKAQVTTEVMLRKSAEHDRDRYKEALEQLRSTLRRVDGS